MTFRQIVGALGVVSVVSVISVSPALAVSQPAKVAATPLAQKPEKQSDALVATPVSRQAPVAAPVAPPAKVAQAPVIKQAPAQTQPPPTQAPPVAHPIDSAAPVANQEDPSWTGSSSSSASSAGPSSSAPAGAAAPGSGTSTATPSPASVKGSEGKADKVATTTAPVQKDEGKNTRTETRPPTSGPFPTNQPPPDFTRWDTHGQSGCYPNKDDFHLAGGQWIWGGGDHDQDDRCPIPPSPPVTAPPPVVVPPTPPVKQIDCGKSEHLVSQVCVPNVPQSPYPCDLGSKPNKQGVCQPVPTPTSKPPVVKPPVSKPPVAAPPVKSPKVTAPVSHTQRLVASKALAVQPTATATPIRQTPLAPNTGSGPSQLAATGAGDWLLIVGGLLAIAFGGWVFLHRNRPEVEQN